MKSVPRKNEFVLELKDTLAGVLGTLQNYVYGWGDFEGIERNGSYQLIRKNSDNRDLSGFCFRKDLCSYKPFNSESLKEFITRWTNERGIETIIDKESLRITLENKKYLVFTSIGEGYADYIDVTLIEVPKINL